MPAFEAIRMHSGNFPVDTEGCLLVGRTKLPKPDMIGESRVTLDKLMPVLTKAAKTEKIFIEVLGHRP